VGILAKSNPRVNRSLPLECSLVATCQQ
jgi:hypothetical protein